MAPTPCFHLSPADWVVSSELPWQQLVCFGPSGYGGYARLRFLPDPAFDGQSEYDVAGDAERSDEEQMRMLLEVLATHTRTPEDCHFCLGDGYGDIHGGTAVSVVLSSSDGDLQPGPAVAPAFPPEVMDGPRVVVPGRSYFLFHGPLHEAGDWGAAEMWTGQPRLAMPGPAFVWPADHAWFVASDIDPHWAGIGADTRVIDQLVSDPRLDVVPADPRAAQPAYR